VPDEITRIEFEIAADGRCFWRLWSGEKLTHSELSRPDTLPAMLETTALLITDQSTKPGVHHAEETPRAAEG